MLVQVRSDHIARGIRLSHKYCPIALSLQDQFGSDTDISVGSLAIHVGKPGAVVIHYDVPRVARMFIMNFDGGFPVTPLTFTLMERT